MEEEAVPKAVVSPKSPGLLRSLRIWLKIQIYGLIPSKKYHRLQTLYMLRERAPRTEEAERRFDKILQGLGPDNICLDLGANVGRFTERMAKTGATVHAFEPDPHAFSRLQEATKGFGNVTLYNAAIGPEDGVLTLFRDARFSEDPDRFSVGTGAFSSTLNQTGGESFDVEMVGLRSFLEKLDRPIDLVKMDIEGAEVATLENLIASDAIGRIRNIFVETHEAQMPELRKRTRALRERVRSVRSTYISLDWM